MAPKQTGRYSRNEFVEYPKLELFKGKMKVKRMIHESDHSAVFEVVSDGNHYALKIFKFTDPGRYRTTGRRTIEEQFNGFFCAEARAYISLMEAKIAGNKAPMCYGYLKLDEHDENFLDRKFLVYSWDRPAQNEIYLDPADFKPLGPVGAGDLHLHAIVLEFIDGTTLDKANASIASVAPGLREQLKEFHDAGVCFFDIKPDSIMLVSSTGKHCWLDFSIASTRIGPEDQNADRCQLENAIEKWCKLRNEPSCAWTPDFPKPLSFPEMFNPDASWTGSDLSDYPKIPLDETTFLRGVYNGSMG